MIKSLMINLIKHHDSGKIVQGQGHKVINTDVIWTSLTQGTGIQNTLYLILCMDVASKVKSLQTDLNQYAPRDTEKNPD